MCVGACVFTGAEEGKRQEPSFLSSDRGAGALEIILPQSSGSEPANVNFPSQIMHRKCGDKVGKTEAVWTVFPKTESHAQGMLGFRKLGSVDFLQSREKAEGSLVSGSLVFIQQAGSLPSWVKQRESVVTPALCGQGPSECQQAGHCLPQTHLSVNTGAFVSCWLRGSC